MGIIPYHFQYYLNKQLIKGRYLIVKLNKIDYTVKNTHKKKFFKFRGLIVIKDETGIYTEFYTYIKAAEFIGT